MVTTPCQRANNGLRGIFYCFLIYTSPAPLSPFNCLHPLNLFISRLRACRECRFPPHLDRSPNRTYVASHSCVKRRADILRGNDYIILERLWNNDCAYLERYYGRWIGLSNHYFQEVRPLIKAEQLSTCRILATRDLREEAVFHYRVDVIDLARTAGMHSPATFISSPSYCES